MDRSNARFDKLERYTKPGVGASRHLLWVLIDGIPRTGISDDIFKRVLLGGADSNG